MSQVLKDIQQVFSRKRVVQAFLYLILITLVSLDLCKKINLNDPRCANDSVTTATARQIPPLIHIIRNVPCATVSTSTPVPCPTAVPTVVPFSPDILVESMAIVNGDWRYRIKSENFKTANCTNSLNIPPPPGHSCAHNVTLFAELIVFYD